ncbi:MAG: type II toxin-antitoxin system RelE/ParE family toxin [Lutispora sp.]|nr:type II toxin-antitoxin system RelE/ParE family toxin [Lutispora sp.]MEA4964055.1 type II toxin-antitoxin system RelE/ParE family toxin [Lutispora sp.]
MEYLQIIYAKSAIKAISALERSIKQRIKEGIEGLTKVPPIGDIKQLQGYDSVTYRLRIGKYRVLYWYSIINEEQVLIIKDIGSRGDIYK